LAAATSVTGSPAPLRGVPPAEGFFATLCVVLALAEALRAGTARRDRFRAAESAAVTITVTPSSLRLRRTALARFIGMSARSKARRTSSVEMYPCALPRVMRSWTCGDEAISGGRDVRADTNYLSTF
jgi:hypothetical protein